MANLEARVLGASRNGQRTDSVLLQLPAQVDQRLKDALVLLKSMRAIYTQLELNKRKLGDLVERAGKVVLAADEQLQHTAEGSGNTSFDVSSLTR